MNRTSFYRDGRSWIRAVGHDRGAGGVSTDERRARHFTRVAITDSTAQLLSLTNYLVTCLSGGDLVKSWFRSRLPAALLLSTRYAIFVHEKHG